MKNDYSIKLERISKKLENFLKELKIEMSQLTKNCIEKFVLSEFKCVNRSSYYNNVAILNDILENNNINIKLDSADYVDECVTTHDNRLFTRKEIQSICNLFQNYQDSFIIYALWSGIMGKDYQDLLNIKVTDVSEDYSSININDNKFMCDEYMQKVLRGTIKSNVYYGYAKEKESTRKTRESHFETENEYVIKVAPTKRNGYGMNPMTVHTLQRRLAVLSDAYKIESDGDEINLSGLNLVKSGIMYDMFLKEIEGKSWDLPSIDDYLKLNGYKMNANDLYLMYHMRYHGSRTNVF